MESIHFLALKVICFDYPLFRAQFGQEAAEAAKSFRHKHILPNGLPLFLCHLALIASCPMGHHKQCST